MWNKWNKVNAVVPHLVPPKNIHFNMVRDTYGTSGTRFSYIGIKL